MNIILYGNNDVNSLIIKLENQLVLFSDDLNIKLMVKTELLKIIKKELRLRFFKNKKFHIWIEDTTEQTLDSYLKKYSEDFKSPSFIKNYKRFLDKLNYCQNNLLNYSVTIFEDEIEIVNDPHHWLETQLKELIQAYIRHFKLLQKW
ncbi:MAG: hypothetical protein KC589_06470 [Nanoarchaeota archaeon]|nr:hypothetical protein [Nanoarchaeota archaeon]